MKPSGKRKRIIKNALALLLIMTAVFGVSIAIQNLPAVGEHITTIFVFAVFTG